jgi:hypothetical protein
VFGCSEAEHPEPAWHLEGGTMNCLQLIENVEKQASEGIKFPVAEAKEVQQQLLQCLDEGKITRAQYNAVLELIKLDDSR